MSAEVELKCKECGENLNGEFVRGFGLLEIEPCENCLNKKYKEGEENATV